MKFRTDFAYKFHHPPYPIRPLNRRDEKRERNPRNERRKSRNSFSPPVSSVRSSPSANDPFFLHFFLPNPPFFYRGDAALDRYRINASREIGDYISLPPSRLFIASKTFRKRLRDSLFLSLDRSSSPPLLETRQRGDGVGGGSKRLKRRR